MTKTAKLSDATGELADQLRLYGNDMGRLALRQEQQAARVDMADTLRDAASSTLSSGFHQHGPRRGLPEGRILGAFELRGQPDLERGIGVIASLPGRQGSPFGGVLGSFFGDGPTSFGAYRPQMPGGSGGGLLSGFMSLFGGLGHFATGTDSAPDGLAVVGEQGLELINVPRRSQVLTANQTSGMISARQSDPVNIEGHTIYVQGGGDPK